ncbi:MAG: S8 family serine peptidase [Elusimicrobiota bacterium]
MKSLLSVALSLSLLASALGPGASAAVVANLATPAAPTVSVTPVAPLGAGISQGMQITPALMTPGLGATLSLPMTPALQSVQTLSPLTGAQAAPVARPVAAVAVTQAAPIQTLRGSKELRQAVQAAQDPGETPFAKTMKDLSREMPEFNNMGSGESKTAAEADFQARIGEPAAVTAAASQDDMVEFIVTAKDGSGRQVTQDIYPTYLSEGVSPQKVETALQQQFSQLGVTKSLLGVHAAVPLGTLSKINAAVLRVPESQSASLMNALQTLGLDVQVGRKFSLPQPMAAEPEAKTVGLKEMAKIIRADKLQDELKKVLGEPTPPAPAAQQARPSFLASIAQSFGKFFRRMAFGVAVSNPVLPWALLDSWSFVDHPFMKGHFIKSVANDDDGESHGTHTGGTVVGMDPWNFHGRNYNIFPNGSASEADILFKLNMAQQDGALATTNSWGDGSGNPAGAIEKLFAKTASEGVHHSISAGNAGSSKNTIGGPAIMFQNADLVINGKVIGQVKRIKAIAASDADKKTAYFSSRGKGSRTTARDPKYKDWPQKPDESGVGVNLVAPVPKGSNVAELGGPGASMSGTSMSNPGVFGGFMLLTRGILVLLADVLPKLPTKELQLFAMDLARYSMTQTAQKVAPLDEVGDGFVDIWASYEYAAKLLKDSAPKPILTRIHQFIFGGDLEWAK